MDSKTQAEQFQERVDGIRNELELIAGNYYFQFQGNRYPLYSEDPQFWSQEGEGYSYDEDTDTYTVDGEEIITPPFYTMWDYLDELADVVYMVNDHKDYLSCRVMTECGGPDTYLNTFENRVEMYWGGRYYADFGLDVSEAIDEVMRERYEMC